MADRIAGLIEELAGLLVLAEPGDDSSLQALADAAAQLRDEAAGGPQAEAAEVVASFARRTAAGEVPDVAAALRLLGESIGEIRTAHRVGPSSAAIDPEDDELLHEFVVKANEYLDSAEEQLLGIERGEGDSESVDAVFRAFHTIKGMTGFLSLDGIRALAHEGESLLEPARQHGEALQPATVDAALGAIDEMRAAISGLGESGTAATGERDAAIADAATGGAGRSAGQAPATAAHGADRESVRVDAERLDQLLDAIGELVIAESMASRTARVETGSSAQLEQQLARLDKLTRQLHEMAASLRMVPLRPTFRRLARAVRDLARQSGKPIELVVSGEDTELDRAAVDLIGDSLLHIVRNAVDHGIEPAEERTALGKPAAGRVELRAYHKAGNIYVEVSDDGQGLRRDAIVAKARALGLLAEDELPTERELSALIARAGFSTAETVTDVSGRGVGMDVVKQTIDSLGGQVTVRSEEGAGCTFVLRMPVTLAVIDGMTVRVGGERYIVPTLSVVRSLRPADSAMSSVLGTGEVLDLDDELLRLIRLRDVLEPDTRGAAGDGSIVMVVEDDGRKAGLVIDEILGQQQIVIKSLGEALGEVTGVSGGAVMPDGRVGLILDVEGLVALADEA